MLVRTPAGALVYFNDPDIAASFATTLANTLAEPSGANADAFADPNPAQPAQARRARPSRERRAPTPVPADQPEEYFGDEANHVPDFGNGDLEVQSCPSFRDHLALASSPSDTPVMSSSCPDRALDDPELLTDHDDPTHFDSDDLTVPAPRSDSGSTAASVLVPLRAAPPRPQPGASVRARIKLHEIHGMLASTEHPNQKPGDLDQRAGTRTHEQFQPGPSRTHALEPLEPGPCTARARTLEQLGRPGPPVQHHGEHEGALAREQFDSRRVDARTRERFEPGSSRNRALEPLESGP